MLIKNFIKQFVIRSYNLIRLDLLNDINKLKQNDRNQFIQLEIKNLLLQKQLKFNLKNKKIQIYILIYHRAHWGAMDSVYNELKLNGFDVTIIITPALNIQKELRYNEMEQNYKFFNSLGYKVVKGYDFKTNSLFNIEESLPDIIIYQTHWMADYPYEYNIMHYYNKALCISIPYSYMLAAIQNEQFNQEFHDLVWFNCATTKADKIMAEKYSIVHAKNVIVTGYPKMDYLFDDNQIKSNTKWKNIQTKKIIYAPHYSINTRLGNKFCNF